MPWNEINEKITSFLKLLLALVVLGSGGIAWGDCAGELRLLQSIYQRGFVLLEPDPYSRIKQELPHLAGALATIENDVLKELWEQPPETRETSVRRLMHQWRELLATEHVSEPLVRDILDYYAFRIFFDDLLVLGNPEQVRARIGKLYWEHFLTDTKRALARRYLYYLYSIGKQSVPEMAKAQGIRERQVYQELSQLGLSLETAFHEPIPSRGKSRLEILTEGINEGRTFNDVAKELGMSRQAIDFYAHFEGIAPRGVRWDTLLYFRGKPTSRKEILRSLLQDRWSQASIAQELNRLANIHNPNDPQWTSQTSVAMQIAKNGWAAIRPEGPNIPLAEYGLVKENGQLQFPVVRDFLHEHPNQYSLGELVQLFDSTHKTLYRFLLKHRLIPFLKQNEAQAPRPAARPQNRAQATQNLLKHYDAIRLARLAAFANEGGGIDALENVNNFTKATPEALASLLPDELTKEEKANALSFIQAQNISKTAGHHARKWKTDGTPQRPGTADSVYRGLLAAVKFYNAWREENPARRAHYEPIDEASLSSPASIREARRRMRPNDLSYVEVPKEFGIEGGGIDALENVKNFAKATPEALASLLPDELTEEEKANALSFIQAQNISKRAGNNARNWKPDGTPIQPRTSDSVYRGLLAVVKFYNAWREEHPARRTHYQPINEESLSSPASIREARRCMRPNDLSYVEVPQEFGIKGGGIDALENLNNFTKATPEALASLLPDELTEEEKANALKFIQAQNISKTAGNNARNWKTDGTPIYPRTSDSVYRGLLAAVKFYNAWREEHPALRTHYQPIDEASLSSPASIREARRRMRPNDLSYVEVPKEFGIRGGGIDALENLNNFTIATPEALASLLPDELTEEEKTNALKFIQAQNIRKGAGGDARQWKPDGTPIQPRTSDSVYRGLLAAVKFYNAWREEHPALRTHYQPINEASLSSFASIREARRRMRPNDPANSPP